MQESQAQTEEDSDSETEQGEAAKMPQILAACGRPCVPMSVSHAPEADLEYSYRMGPSTQRRQVMPDRLSPVHLRK